MQRYVVSSFVAFLAQPNCSTSHKGQEFREKVIEHKVYVLNFTKNVSIILLILRKIQQDIVINMETSSCKVPLILVRF
jgi:hypothetical protein